MLSLSEYPKVLKTKEDYLFVKENFPFRYWMEDLVKLEEESYEQIVVAVLDKKDEKEFIIKKKFDFNNPVDVKLSNSLMSCIQDNPTYLVLNKGEFAEKPEWEIYECRDNYFAIIKKEKDDSKMKQLGFTHEEIQELLDFKYEGESENGNSDTSISGTIENNT